MKRLALFTAIAVGFAVAWEVSKLPGGSDVSQDAPASPEIDDSETLAAAGDTVAPPENLTAPIAAFFEPVKDVIVTIKRAAFGTPYDDLIAASANTYGIPPEVLYKLLRQESHFRPDIIDGRTKSPVGALGIAQFMPATAIEELGSTTAALDPTQAIPGAARYLAKLRGMLGGDLVKAVAAYNWGVGNVKRKGLSAAPAETRAYAMAITGVSIA